MRLMAQITVQSPLLPARWDRPGIPGITLGWFPRITSRPPKSGSKLSTQAAYREPPVKAALFILITRRLSRLSPFTPIPVHGRMQPLPLPGKRQQTARYSPGSLAPGIRSGPAGPKRYTSGWLTGQAILIRPTVQWLRYILIRQLQVSAAWLTPSQTRRQKRLICHLTGRGRQNQMLIADWQRQISIIIFGTH